MEGCPQFTGVATNFGTGFGGAVHSLGFTEAGRADLKLYWGEIRYHPLFLCAVLEARVCCRHRCNMEEQTETVPGLTIYSVHQDWQVWQCP